MEISFVIPALNEEENIPETIHSIKTYSPFSGSEIIVVDNGSTDNTVQFAIDEGAKVLKNSGGTIAKSRNIGASHASGKVFVFLDADVLLTEEWGKEIKAVIKKLTEDYKLITGSRCGCERENNWILKYWFDRMRFKKNNYINSGHLITTKKLFDEINGFDESLTTAEDYDFSMRAKEVGAQLEDNQQLYVIHKGYPKTIKDFINRERWHGKEDFLSLNKLLSSKEAILGILNTGLFLTALLLSVYYHKALWIILYMFITYLLGLLLTFYKFGKSSLTQLFIGGFIGNLYMMGRSLAFLEALKKIAYR